MKLKTLADKFQNKMYKYIHKLKVNYPYKRFFKDVFFDVIVSYSLHIGTEMALNIKSNRYCVFMHSSDPNYHREIANKTIFDYSKIICVSEGVKLAYEEIYKSCSEKMIVIENYVDANKVIDLSLESLQIPINTSALILCTCGRLSEEKGFDLAVESAYLLKQKGVVFTWYFVGDGDERKKIEELIDKYSLQNNIIITGYVQNPYPYMRVCDIYVQPSYQESFGLTIKEAVILNKAVVSTDTVGAHTILDKKNFGEIVSISAEKIVEGILNANNKVKSRSYNQYCIFQNNEEKTKYINLLEKMLDE